MNKDSCEISVAAVGLATEHLDGFTRAGFEVLPCPTIGAGLSAVRDGRCHVLVMAQPGSWSTASLGHLLVSTIGNHAAIVLAPGMTYAPGISVVSAYISIDRLVALVKRVTPPGAQRSNNSPVNDHQSVAQGSPFRSAWSSAA